jgi:hypothetical protein
MTGIRWVLHPFAPTLALLGLACVAATAGVLGVAVAAPLLAVVAGCAAGFANSGST